ncbi:MAG: TIGR04282 family arsenosugar biosynthesis glycosyltransferase [Gammaproteobacteria bacterium]|nr:TIGR04282 family arsenosugar biosynthesis glycosyltransferase [Gammaproteobacteria bacterium]
MTRGVERTLIAFAKVPRPGRVKTRLAAAIGDAEAASLYRVMGRRILDGVRGGDYRVVVYIDPANELAAARAWLGAAGVDFRPQKGDGLGERLADAFRTEFKRARRVCAIGTDAPAVDRPVVERAFAQLSTNDLVLGPALDGGYYLIGTAGYRPELFREVPWSTEEVMTVTLARARALKLRTAALEPLPDIDTVEDLERAGAPPW